MDIIRLHDPYSLGQLFGMPKISAARCGYKQAEDHSPKPEPEPREPFLSRRLNIDIGLLRNSGVNSCWARTRYASSVGDKCCIANATDAGKPEIIAFFHQAR